MLNKMFERTMPLYDTEPTGGPVGTEEAEVEGEKDPELADPETDEGEKDPESADPEEQGTKVQTPEENAAFAAMRRENERLKREREERDALLSTFFPGVDDPLTAAMMQAYGKSQEEIKAEREAKEEQARKDAELEALRQLLAQSTYEKDLSAIKKAYPEIKAKKIEDLGQEFMKIMATGELDAVTAYEIVRAKEEKTKKNPPPEIGKINSSNATDKGFYTMEEVRAMSQEEVSKNWDKIQKSRSKW